MSTREPIPKRLYRSRDVRMIAGVAGGLAAYLAIDPTIIRLAFVILALSSGVGILIYVAMLIIVPEEPLAGEADRVALPAEQPAPPATTDDSESRPAAGIE